MVSTKGLTTSGASVWPTKMLAAAASVSEPLVFMVFLSPFARPTTIHCMMPKW
jgi:hypothetical protein